MSGDLPDGTEGSLELYNLMAANYATFRIYDFTLENEQGGSVAARMPPSMSGVDTNAARVPDPFGYFAICS